MALSNVGARQAAVSTMKQSLILDAARDIFEADGIEGASIRAIAKRAGYTPGAIYFHFASKEDIYAALLERSLDALIATVHQDAQDARSPAQGMHDAGQRFFDFYADNPRDLDLGFYLFRGGMQPHSLGREKDQILNTKLLSALAPFKSALIEMGCDEILADIETAAYFAHASGLLLLQHTGRMTLFETNARQRMTAYLDSLEQRIHHVLAVSA